jgi:hypothetical protein
MGDKPETRQERELQQNEEAAPPAQEALPQDDVHNVVDEKGLDDTNLEDGLAEQLSPEHREYLLARHGTLDLVPLPTMDPADPLNWPSWKVWIRFSGNITRLTVVETYQSGPRCLPRYDDHLHSSRSYSCFRAVFYRSGSLADSSLLHNKCADPRVRRLATLLEAHLESVWPQTDLADIYLLLHDMQHRMRREPFVRRSDSY